MNSLNITIQRNTWSICSYRFLFACHPEWEHGGITPKPAASPIFPLLATIAQSTPVTMYAIPMSMVWWGGKLEVYSHKIMHELSLKHKYVVKNISAIENIVYISFRYKIMLHLTYKKYAPFPAIGYRFGKKDNHNKYILQSIFNFT